MWKQQARKNYEGVNSQRKAKGQEMREEQSEDNFSDILAQFK